MLKIRLNMALAGVFIAYIAIKFIAKLELINLNQ